MAWKLEKTIPFDLYSIGDRAMEDVIYNVTIVIDATDNIFCTSAQVDEDCIPYLESIGGKGVVGHWQQEVLAFFQNEDNCAEELGESMTEEEFGEWEHILVPGNVESAVEPRAIKASLASDIVDGWMENK